MMLATFVDIGFAVAIALVLAYLVALLGTTVSPPAREAQQETQTWPRR